MASPTHPARLGLVSALCVGILLVLAACQKRPRTGELFPPRNAPAWEGRFGVAYDDDYTRQLVNLTGRAPNDVLDQRLFGARLGHAALVALVRVEQVWGRGRYQSRPKQFLDVEILDVLLGELPRDTSKEQLIRVASEDDLPGSLQGQDMILFLRWAPGESPAYHHHLMPAELETVAFIRAMVKDAQKKGVLTQGGKARPGKMKRAQRRQKRREKKAAKAKIEAGTSEPTSEPKPKSAPKTEPKKKP